MQFKLRATICLLLSSLFISLCLLFHIYYRTNSDENFPSKRTEGGEEKVKVIYSSSEGCETVHIAMIVGGYNATKYSATLLKSLLFYRHSPLHLHFIVDSTAHEILAELMTTWQLPLVRYTLHSITDSLLERVQWIPNAHYSGVYGLIKLLLPNILEINEVIVLDTDLTVLSDIGELWKYFGVLKRDKKWLGLVENQSNWYRGTIWKDHKPWPAIGRGFNTGVMLLDLRTMRKSGWATIWANITNTTLIEYKYTALADQDIINTVIKTRPYILALLPCNWNVQLSDHTQSQFCNFQAHQYKIIHWNSPDKTRQELNNNNNNNNDNNHLHEHTQYFRNLHIGFQQFDGNHHRNNLLNCYHDNDNTQYNNNIKQSSPKIDAKCFSFLYEANQTFRTHLYYFGERYTAYDDHDTTLVTQLSLDRIQNVHSLLRHWEGPITLVLYCTDSELYEVSEYLSSFSTLTSRRNIAIHVVYKQGHFYPINLLRNIGLQYSSTPYVFLSDIDFLPMFNLYNYLREAIKVLKLNTLKRALVIPAFEFLQYKYEYPNSKSTLLKMLQQTQGGRIIQEFRHTIWSNGHSATNYDKWYRASNPYKVQWSMDYEPYIAVHRNVTRYDGRFVGFGWNKVSHVMELYAEGYEFIVVPDGFIIHSPHGPSLDIMKYRTHRNYRECLNKLKRSFIDDLILKYDQDAKYFEKAYEKQLTFQDKK